MAILKTGKTIGVCVHHSVYPPANNMTELKAQAKLFDSWHKSKSWASTIKTGGEYGYQYIEYHYLLGLDGSLLQVQDEKYVLYHAGDNFRGDLSFNLHGVAVCLTGNYENDVPTDAQMLALVQLIRSVESKYKIDAMVRVHKETSQSATACAGKNVGTHTSGWLKSVIANVNNKNYPPTPPVVEPVDPTVELKVQIELLKGQITGLKEALGASQSQLKLLQERVVFLEEDKKGWQTEIDNLNKKEQLAIEDSKKWKKQYTEAVTELNALKEGRDNWLNRLADALHKLFSGGD